MENYGRIDPGPHHISFALRFADPNNHNYQLQWDSLAIDAGTDTFAPVEALYGDVRPQDGDQEGIAGIDPGADELLQ